MANFLDTFDFTEDRIKFIKKALEDVVFEGVAKDDPDASRSYERTIKNFDAGIEALKNKRANGGKFKGSKKDKKELEKAYSILERTMTERTFKFAGHEDEKITLMDYFTNYDTANRAGKNNSKSNNLLDTVKSLFNGEVDDETAQRYADKLGHELLGKNKETDKSNYTNGNYEKIEFDFKNDHNAEKLGELYAQIENDKDIKVKLNKEADIKERFGTDATKRIFSESAYRKRGAIEYSNELNDDFEKVAGETEDARKELENMLREGKNKKIIETLKNGGQLETPEDIATARDLKQKFDDINEKYNKIATKRGVEPEEFYKKIEKKDGYTTYTNNSGIRASFMKNAGFLNNVENVNDNGWVKRVNSSKEDVEKMTADFSNAMYDIDAMYTKDKASVDKLLEDNYDKLSTNQQKFERLRKAGLLTYDNGPDEVERLHKGIAAGINAGLSNKDEGYAALNKDIEKVLNSSKVHEDNIAFFEADGKNGGLSLNYQDPYNHKARRGITINQEAINLMTKEEKEKYLLKEGENFTNEFIGGIDNSLKDLNETLINRNFEQQLNKQITEQGFNISADEYKRQTQEFYKTLKDPDSKSEIKDLSLTKEQQLKRLGASDGLIEKLKKGDSLTNEDLIGFELNKKGDLTENVILFGNMKENDAYSLLGVQMPDDAKVSNDTPITGFTANRLKEKIDSFVSADNYNPEKVSKVDFNLDLKDEKAITQFIEDLNAGKDADGKIDYKKVMQVLADKYIHVDKEKNVLTPGKILNTLRNEGEEGVSKMVAEEFKNNKESSIKKIIDTVSKELLNSDDEQAKKMGQFLKDSKFDAETIDGVSFKNIADKTPEMPGVKQGKAMKFVKDVLKSKPAKIIGGVAAAVGIGSLAIGAMNNAADERERKRQEMNMLIASQNASIRGGY